MDVFPYIVCTVLSLLVDWAFTVGWLTFEGTKVCGFCRALRIYILEIVKSPRLLYTTCSSSNNISCNMLYKINFWISDDQYATNISTCVSPDVVAFEL